jgi:hypothetical protein
MDAMAFGQLTHAEDLVTDRLGRRAKTHIVASTYPNDGFGMKVQRIVTFAQQKSLSGLSADSAVDPSWI